jgi:hypothetical protein
MGTVLRLFGGEGTVAAAVIGIASVGIWLTYLAAVLLGLRLYREILHSEQLLASKVRRHPGRYGSDASMVAGRRGSENIGLRTSDRMHDAAD